MPLTTWLCVTCGVAVPDASRPPEACRICDDERQFVPPDGQSWVSLEALRATHVNGFEGMEPNLVRIGTRPSFGIGQHAFLIRTPGGNVLWDCISLIDDETVAEIRRMGGISAIALSHPHYYSTIDLWSEAFDAPVYIHEADADWIVRRPARLELWSGTQHRLTPELTLVHGGGHFEGSAMLHWSAGAGGRGVLLPGDTVQVVHDRRWVSFMYSYMNLIPLSAEQIDHLVDVLEPFAFERIYSPWPGRIVQADGKAVVRRSRDRYIAALHGNK